MMNFWLLASGAALLLLSFVHIFLGGRKIHLPMLATDLGTPSKTVWSVVWHAMTFMMLSGGAALVLAAVKPEQALALAALPLAQTATACGLFIAYSLIRFGTLRVLPHWMAFGGITMFGVIGLLA